MPDAPLVTVVCLCHNQARFVAAALASVRAQRYPAVEMIVVDDGSRDGSVAAIKRALADLPDVAFLHWPGAVGNCRAFNRALARARGKYVIDLAADDLLLPDAVARQVAAFQALTDDWAVVFADAHLIDERSEKTGTHYRRDGAGRLRQPVPRGNVYQALLGRFFLLSCTVMYRRQTLLALGGYDETLAYEDFDVLMRLARDHQFFFLDAATVGKRRVAGSLSGRFYRRRGSALQRSTLRVCQKVYAMNRTPAEHAALAGAVRYHLRQAFLTENYPLVPAYFALLRQTGGADVTSRLLTRLARLRLPVAGLYRVYRTWRSAWTGR